MVNYGFDVNDLIKQNRVSAEDIKVLENWSKNLSQQQIVIFLLACDNNIELVKKCWKGYVEIRSTIPEVFEKRNTLDDDLVMQLEIVKYCLIPKRTNKNYGIIINKVFDPTPSKYHMDLSMKYLFMIYDSLIYNSPPAGVIIIFDMDNTSARHITRTKLSLLKTLSTYVQNFMPLKIQEIHIMNALWFLPKFLTLLKPFMQKELMSKIHIHLKDDLDEFYANSVPKTHLPVDYGGFLASIKELHQDTYKMLTLLNDHFLEDELERKEFKLN